MHIEFTITLAHLFLAGKLLVMIAIMLVMVFMAAGLVANVGNDGRPLHRQSFPTLGDRFSDAVIILMASVIATVAGTLPLWLI